MLAPPVHADQTRADETQGDIEPNFLFSLPWDEIESVLTLGETTAPTAALVARCVAHVSSARAIPDGALSHAPESFDLIVMEGVFDNAGPWQHGKLREQQARFLAQVVRLLKPNGYLYLSASTRFGLGARQRVSRRSTHTPARYARMLQEAGCGSVEVYGAHPNWRSQRLLYRLSDAPARRVTRALVDAPVTRKGGLLRRLVDAGPWYRILENEVVVLGRKHARPGRLTWADLPHVGPITQFSTATKTFALCFSENQPVSVYIGGKIDYASERLEHEYRFLQSMTERHRPERWNLRWPAPLGSLRLRHQTLFHYEYVLGFPLNRLLMPISFDSGRFLHLLERLMANYVDLCRKLTTGETHSAARTAEEMLEKLARFPIRDANLAERVARACRNLGGSTWPIGVVHGDLSLPNTIVRADGTMVLVDWENVAGAGLAAIDLVRLLYDTWNESAWLKPTAHHDLMERAREAARRALGRLDIGPEGYADVEALFAGHQHVLSLVRNHESRDVLQAFQDRSFRLA